MGTSEMAIPLLEVLIKSKNEVCLVVSKPDKMRVNQAADDVIEIHTAITAHTKKHNLNIFQPEELKESEVIKKLSTLNPDAIVVAAYGKTIPKEVLAIPKHGCIKIHNSLFPKYRGDSPIPSCIINGNTVTGVTTMLLDEGKDTGDILMQSKIYIKTMKQQQT